VAGEEPELAVAKRHAAGATAQAAGSLGDAVSANARQRGAGAALVQAADHELSLSAGLDAPGTEERIESVFERILHAAARQAGRGTGLLATIGATAPFVGLFGTVWGIMNSFIGISKAQTTNLAVVAPGIAEALLATAIGWSRRSPRWSPTTVSADVDRYANRVTSFADEFSVVLSRELDGPRSSGFDGSRAA
jgi:biopolymer transport protein ExbB